VPAGTAVEIRSRFDGSWTAGFEVDEVIDDASPQYRVRRLSDGALLPRLFAAGEVAERSP
ncbi:MAG TPA: hypothetical protein VGO92_05815, partial [Acidimicrobiales bacterium]|jgi:hypothetical protein|nr:hypothetical protein [Acidimicrobiales bacterium]